MDITFLTNLARNLSIDYEIWNSNNEVLAGIRFERFYMGDWDTLYMNISYFNGSEYLYSDYSFDYGNFYVKMSFNESWVDICIEEPSRAFDDCDINIIEENHGTTTNNPSKFYMAPRFKNVWGLYTHSYIILDSIRYSEDYDIDYKIFSEDNVSSHLIEEEGREYLELFVTDYYHYPEYRYYAFSITTQGICTQEEFNHTTIPTQGLTDGSRNFSEVLGLDVFDKAFYILLFLSFMFIILMTRNMELTLVITGITGLIVSYLASGDITQMATSLMMIAIALTLLVTRK